MAMYRFVSACAFLMMFYVLPGAGEAFAQATRTWVSGVGDDANPCSRTAPCKTFAGAISKTAAGGAINCIDPGGFGALTITKSIAILCEDVEAGVLAAGTNAININVTATDVVFLRGLDIEGHSTGLVGVNIIQGGTVHIEDCTIRGFRSGTAFGVRVASTASPTRLFISNTSIVDNGTGATGGGVSIAPAAGGDANVVVKNSRISHNIAGVVVNGATSTATADLTIDNSEIAGNTNTGVLATSSGTGSPAKVAINNSVLMDNGPAAMTANGTGIVPAAGSAIIRIGNSVVMSNVAVQTTVGQGQVRSYQTNMVAGNANNSTPIPSVGLN